MFFHSDQIKREGVAISFYLVRMARFELASFRRQILSLLCMPFHHIRSKNIILLLRTAVNP